VPRSMPIKYTLHPTVEPVRSRLPDGIPPRPSLFGSGDISISLPRGRDGEGLALTEKKHCGMGGQDARHATVTAD
jgi:hypothetical protein